MKKIIEWLKAVPATYLWLFILGETLCVALAVLIHITADFACWIPMAIAFATFIYIHIRTKKPPLIPFIWFCIGTLIPQIFFWLR